MMDVWRQERSDDDSKEETEGGEEATEEGDGDWVAAVDALGRTYYYHTRTLDVTWEDPTRARGDARVRHMVARVGTCIRIGLAYAMQRALRTWRDFALSRPSRRFVPPMAQVFSEWKIQRDRAVAAVAGSMLLQDHINLLQVRVRALESTERAEVEFDRLRRHRRRS